MKRWMPGPALMAALLPATALYGAGLSFGPVVNYLVVENPPARKS